MTDKCPRRVRDAQLLLLLYARVLYKNEIALVGTIPTGRRRVLITGNIVAACIRFRRYCHARSRCVYAYRHNTYAV